jgi:hypothetical protein
MERAIGNCFVATGILTVTGFIIHPHAYSADVQIAWFLGHCMIFIGLVLNLIGLAWMYSSERNSLGKLGLFGFIAICIGLSHYIGKLYWSGFLFPLVAQAHPEFIAEIGLGPGSTPKATSVMVVFNSGAIIFAGGYAAFGTALFRAKTFPVVPVILLVFGGVMVGMWPAMPNILQTLSPVISAIYTIGLVWIGGTLIRRHQHSSNQGTS